MAEDGSLSPSIEHLEEQAGTPDQYINSPTSAEAEQLIEFDNDDAESDILDEQEANLVKGVEQACSEDKQMISYDNETDSDDNFSLNSASSSEHQGPKSPLAENGEEEVMGGPRTPDDVSNETNDIQSETKEYSSSNSDKTGEKALDKLDAVDDELDYGDDDDVANELHGIGAAEDEQVEKAVESEEDGEIADEEEGEMKEETHEDKEEPEEGEIEDPYSRPHLKSKPCRFFMSGHCTWGFNCRFMHPGINDKGNYRLLTHPEFERRQQKPPPEEEQKKEKSLSPPPGPPKVETAWERGLRQAKEALKRASRKKEMEIDIEDKKMNLSLNDLENKENERKYRDPYYDSLQYDDLDPVQAIAYAEPMREEPGSWPMYEEDFDVQWTQANYDLPMPDRMMRRDLGPLGYHDPYEYGGSPRRPCSPPPFHRQPSPSFRRDAWKRERRLDQRGHHVRGGRNSRMPTSDTWVDPWQRAKEKPAARKSRNRHRRSRSGSSRNSSFSSRSRSSRSSSFSSMSSGSRSRTRTPTPLRNVRPARKLQQKPSGGDRQIQQRGGLAMPNRDVRRGPEWPTGPPPRDRPPAVAVARHWQPQPRSGQRPPMGDSRLSRRDLPDNRKDAGKKRRDGSSSSSSGSSSSSSDSSRSSSSSSSGSSSSSDSDIDSDELYAGISKSVPKEKKTKKKRSEPAKPEPKTSVSKPTKGQTEQKKDPLKASTSVSQIKLTIVNKSKVQPKKRVLDSPPPEPEPLAKKFAGERPVSSKPAVEKNANKLITKPSKSKTNTVPVKSAPTKVPSTANKPTTAKKVAPNRREELLKQLKAVEDAIAKKRKT